MPLDIGQDTAPLGPLTKRQSTLSGGRRPFSGILTSSLRIRKAVSTSPAPKKAVRFEETGKENIVAVEKAKQNKVTGCRIAVWRVVVHENGVVNESAVKPAELHVSAILLACS
jgi:hypothetical protein